MSAKSSSCHAFARLGRCGLVRGPRIRSLPCKQKRRASLAASHEGKEICHVPAEIGELLVNTLESHGCCVYMCGVGCGVEGIAGVGVERVGVEELKWDVCAGKAVS
jgi:hypothetical protein